MSNIIISCVITLVYHAEPIAMLGMKPVFKSMGDVPSKLARLGHILESGRNHCAFTAGVMTIIDTPGMFVFKAVGHLPPEVIEWQRKSKEILRRSRPALDLTEEEEDVIVAADGGDWDEEFVCHYCLGELCPLKCGGSKVRSKTLV